jgi:hypothetical protein
MGAMLVGRLFKAARTSGVGRRCESGVRAWASETGRGQGEIGVESRMVV